MERNTLPRLLIVGPLPPPVGGASVSFEIFCQQLQEQFQFEHLKIINSSAAHYKPRSHILTSEGIRRALRILRQYLRQIRQVDKVLVFGTNGFILSLFPFLMLAARFFRKPCCLQVFGGSLDIFYANLPFPLRLLLNVTLRQCQHIIVETEPVYRFFKPWLKEKLFTFPGFRLMVMDTNLSCEGELAAAVQPTQPLKLVYLGHIKEAKGVFVLLDSLTKLYQEGLDGIICDFYGPATPGDSRRLAAQLSNCPGSRYMGTISPQEVVATLCRYDALVFPTYYPNEGHPGVILEAMDAGVPVITTRYRAIPDLVEHGLNGLLVEARDSDALAQAIQLIYHDRHLLAQMGENNHQRRSIHDARKLVPQIMEVVLH